MKPWWPQRNRPRNPNGATGPAGNRNVWDVSKQTRHEAKAASSRTEGASAQHGGSECMAPQGNVAVRIKGHACDNRPNNFYPSDSPAQLDFASMGTFKGHTARFIPRLVIRPPVNRSAPSPPRTISDTTSFSGIMVTNSANKMVSVMLWLAIASPEQSTCLNPMGIGSTILRSMPSAPPYNKSWSYCQQSQEH